MTTGWSTSIPAFYVVVVDDAYASYNASTWSVHLSSAPPLCYFFFVLIPYFPPLPCSCFLFSSMISLFLFLPSYMPT
ncbi:hypothetical protein BDQ94DRAFT_153640 [Aspergillus welwitschiae]|uniref:Uncharacterized protein n=1 Tax=Aspergillus welwitschiae TaxID=1341132 RepID=A0A3F3PL68_9EURO|nr:hypothetical protein BDQ94DRAFT_153640 [Aspergillus welwitschiae]RDH27667.1 hypothetical protein BDQ94DRAFT_153640 [Aspergillus welwitschiae]